MKAVGIFGGTFDPIHYGHLITAQTLLELRGLRKIIFIPCYISPHKLHRISSSPKHRLEMLRLAIRGVPYFDYSDIEIERKTVSYSVDTILKLKKKYFKIELIMGYDNIFDFYSWKEPDLILKKVKLIVMKRKVDKIPKRKDKYYESAVFVDTPDIEISSSEIRKRVKESLPLNFLLPEKVAGYIRKHKLYRE